MNITEILLIAFGVSADAAAVSISGSLCPGKYSKWHCAFNAALFFGGFQFIMPIFGAWGAVILTTIIGKYGHLSAFILLSLVGVKMIYEACKTPENESSSCPIGEFFSAKNLLIPAIATSIDALAIGAGINFAGKSIWLPAITMGVATAAISFGCVLLGKKLIEKSKKHNRWLTAAGGLVIVAIGLKILLQYYGIIPEF